MYTKILYNFLKTITDYLSSTMTNVTSSDNCDKTANQQTIYKFKPFHYEEIQPRSKRPYARSGHRIAANAANFYSFGGYNPVIQSEDNVFQEFSMQSFPLFKEMWRFNFAKREWSKYRNRQTLPHELASNAVILYKNILMVYGGTGSPFGIRCSNQLFACRVNDEEALMQEVKTGGEMPFQAYGQALIYFNDYLYTIGGTTGETYSCDIHRLNLKTLTWESVYISQGANDYEPHGRYRHEVAFDSNNIYILGGGTATSAFDFIEIPVFNLAKLKWYPQKTYGDDKFGIPTSRKCHGSVQINNSVFITGGHDGMSVFNDLWRLDLDNFKWTCYNLCEIPYPTYFHGATVSPQGRLYIFGGIQENIGRSHSIYSTWLCIPKLSEMCWEALLHYNPNIVEWKSDALIDIGLPRHFVQRLE